MAKRIGHDKLVETIRQTLWHGVSVPQATDNVWHPDEVADLPLVVGAVIVDAFPDSTRVLAARRTRPPELAGMWEFPGGKVEPGETPQEALVREISEELSVEIEVREELVAPTSETWPASNGYRMRLFFATITQGEAEPADGHDRLLWLVDAELESIEWLPSDRAVIAQLQLGRTKSVE